MKTARNNCRSRREVWWAVLAVGCVLFVGSPAWAQLSGAIFTTLEDGTRVNANLYDDCYDVYLDGGPPVNAPQSAAGLPDGTYYFQVTDPSGKVLLSEDEIDKREFLVIGGVIHTYLGGTHNTGVDVDHNAVTVQLMPFEETPNNGGVYKAWVTPTDKYDLNDPSAKHGFVPRWSKTDNFKCKRGQAPPPMIKLFKFNDVDGNCVLDEGIDEPIAGWMFKVTSPDMVENIVATDSNGMATLVLPDMAGEVVVCEDLGTGFEACPNVLVDGVATPGVFGPLVPPYTTFCASVEITLTGTKKNPEVHEMKFLNRFLTEQEICKFYDVDKDGDWDDGEPGVPGWKFRVYDATDQEIDDSPVYTGEDGCVTLLLPPGSYTIEECLSVDDRWSATTETTCERSIVVTTGDIETLLSVISQSALEPFLGEPCEFGNVCEGEEVANFSTKGYWHNKNGLTELAACVVAIGGPGTTIQDFMDTYVNGLDPYDDPTGYFSKGDEPFDGEFMNGDPVPAGKGILENEDIADAGTVEAEISNFLINPNQDAELFGHREQLAQQLLAFIFNTMCRAATPNAELCNGGDSLTDLINEAIMAWSVGTDADRVEITAILDDLNNNNDGDGVPGICLKFVHDLEDCLPVVFP